MCIKKIIFYNNLMKLYRLKPKPITISNKKIVLNHCGKF